jgi:hypothetical protein
MIPVSRSICVVHLGNGAVVAPGSVDAIRDTVQGPMHVVQPANHRAADVFKGADVMATYREVDAVRLLDNEAKCFCPAPLQVEQNFGLLVSLPQ